MKFLSCSIFVLFLLTSAHANLSIFGSYKLIKEINSSEKSSCPPELKIWAGRKRVNGGSKKKTKYIGIDVFNFSGERLIFNPGGKIKYWGRKDSHGSTNRVHSESQLNKDRSHFKVKHLQKSGVGLGIPVTLVEYLEHFEIKSLENSTLAYRWNIDIQHRFAEDKNVKHQYQCLYEMVPSVDPS